MQVRTFDRSSQTTTDSISNGILSATWDSLLDGGTITISTDGTHDFGAEGPTLLFRQTLEDVADGGDVPADAGGGVGTIDQAEGLVEAAPDLPYGKGKVVGDRGGGRYRVLYPYQADEFYEHYYLQWPDGPDVHIYDTMDRPGADAGDVPSLDAIRGQWQYYENSLPELRPDAHLGAFSALVLYESNPETFQATTEVFLSYCLKIPAGKKFPVATQSGTSPDDSTWKLAWLYNDDRAPDDDDVAIVLPAWAATFRLVGNKLSPDTSIDDESEWWQFGEWLRFSFWLECGPDPESGDSEIRFQVVTEGGETQVVAEGTEPIMDEREPPYAWKRLMIPGWADTQDVSDEDVEALYDDIYLATGANANARVELSDSLDYGASTRIQLCAVRSWSSNRVSARLREGSISAVEGATLHLTTADEQQAVSMEVN